MKVDDGLIRIQSGLVDIVQVGHQLVVALIHDLHGDQLRLVGHDLRLDEALEHIIGVQAVDPVDIHVLLVGVALALPDEDVAAVFSDEGSQERGANLFHLRPGIVDDERRAHSHLVKLLLGLCLSFPGESCLYLRLSRCEVSHGAERRRGVFAGEAMHPHQVKRIQQPPMRGIRGVVTICELIFIDNYAGSTFARDVGVATGDVRFFVDVTEEQLNRLLDVIRPAECADDARLAERISLALHITPDLRPLTGRGRPRGDVAPVSVTVEQVIGVDQRSIPTLEVIMDVSWGGRPEHQAVCLVGGVVEVVKANTSGNGAGHGLVLLFADVAAQGKDQPQARMVRRVFVRPIGTSSEGNLLLDAIHDTRLSIVQVQGHGAAAFNTASLPLALVQVTQHKTADVLDGILPGSRHRQEIC